MSTLSDRYCRAKFILDKINEGLSNKTLHILLEEKFNLKSFAARNKVIKEALADINDGLDKDDIKLSNQERLDMIVERALSNDKYNDALKAIDISNKMNGLYTENKNIKVSTDVIEVEFGM